MKLKYDVDSGWPSQLDERMKKRIGAYTRYSSAFKIGITNWPERRKREYERNNARHYSEMIVLYETSSRSHAGHMETQLIDQNWDRLELRNQIGGGGGPHGEGWYYLYIVRRRRKS